ncbi:MAG: hypothetical protein KDB35_21395 [Acidimicrobiales bacterium]|nr:hypothetical protein [Acidimicrobiales bacterium]
MSDPGRARPARPVRHAMAGLIAGAGFASGDRLVVGHWSVTPLGPFSDVMWASPDGTRTLWVADERIGAFISAVYRFDAVEVTDLVVEGDARRLTARADWFDLTLTGGRARPIPFRRPAWFTRHVEGPIARAVMGVRTYGVSPTGVREWYRADAWRPVTGGHLTVRGEDLGAPGPVRPAAGFGFSEPPERPTITRVRPLLEDPTGALDALLDRLRPA